jgi:hypothetical protein
VKRTVRVRLTLLNMSVARVTRQGERARDSRGERAGQASQGLTMYHPFIPMCRWENTWQW